MSLTVFDEAFYLANYADVRAAVNAGAFRSGQEHFEQFGRQEGRRLVSRFYDEGFYLQRNPDVASVVAAGGFRSGLEHFIQFGETEGRVASLLFDEEWYKRRYPDVVGAIAVGAFQSGLDHFKQFGEAEGRSGTPFNEFGYLDANPDVKGAVVGGAFKSGLEHYIKSGQFENRTGVFFSGTSSNDTVTAFGQLDELYGVDLSPGPCVMGGTVFGGVCLDVQSFGVNEVDVLRGGAGKDTFVLGNLGSSRIGTSARRFYVGGGNADFALVENFEIGKDRIQLAGQASDYLFNTSDGNVNISLSRRGSFDPLPSPDLVGIVQGVRSLSESDGSLSFLPATLG